MKIATMVTGCITTPQPFGLTYAPIDIAVAVCEGLQALGHKVDYYGPVGSHLGVPVVTGGLEPFPKNENGQYVYPNAPGQEEKLCGIWDEFFIAEMLRRANNGEYDVLLIHPIDRGIIMGRILPNVQIIYTLHDPITPWRADIYRRFLTPNQHLVSITDAQRNPAPDLPYLATVYNGIDVEMFAFNETPGDYVMFASRMVEEKNPSGAIKAAQLAEVPINLFGEILQGDSTIYFNEVIKPQLNDSVKYCGFVSRDELVREYGGAKALLAPITWEEPFGLVFTEAMACGTPVIAFRRGSVPELIVDGVTGFIVDTIEEMAEAIKKIDTIDRKACREHVLNKFSNQSMINGYNEALSKLITDKQ